MKQALIVGGNGGLGNALVKLLLDRNIQVAVAGRSRAADDRVRHSHIIDATSVEWRSLYSAIELAHAMPIDAVVFVAGTSAYGRTAAFPPEKGREIFELNFWACAASATMATAAGLSRAEVFSAVWISLFCAVSCVSSLSRRP